MSGKGDKIIFEKLNEARKSLIKLKWELVSGKLTKTHEVKKQKREVARLLTQINMNKKANGNKL